MTMLSDGMLMGAGATNSIDVISSSVGSTSAAGLTIDNPSDNQIGDLLVIFAFGSPGFTAISLTGWTAILSDTAGTRSFFILTRTVDGSEGASFTFTASTAAKKGIMVRLRGGSGLLDVIGTVTQASSATATAPSITAAHVGILLAFFGATTTGLTVVTPPSGLAAIVADGAGTYTGAAYKLSGSPTGSSGAKTATFSGSANNGGVLVQFY